MSTVSTNFIGPTLLFQSTIIYDAKSLAITFFCNSQKVSVYAIHVMESSGKLAERWAQPLACLIYSLCLWIRKTSRLLLLLDLQISLLWSIVSLIDTYSHHIWFLKVFDQFWAKKITGAVSRVASLLKSKLL